MENDINEIQEKVAHAARSLLLEEALGSSRNLQSESPGDDDRSQEEIRKQAEDCLKDNRILGAICPLLLPVAADISEIAKTVTAALIPLSVGPQPVICISILMFAWIAVTIFKRGFDSICSENK